ncbi:hypothetical protein WICPIJ_006366 [Wickerhamomyces pijperi]|uniref:Uncharacterized protein n=1 Tax=Wickerhamomyces pijperi TaxID=599730 RepID=A0A9P8Q2F7_WICPI|nr:hypothetical protein WICPIJ_006366 [Wickerhamomyces pijperi]
MKFCALLDSSYSGISMISNNVSMTLNLCSMTSTSTLNPENNLKNFSKSDLICPMALLISLDPMVIPCKAFKYLTMHSSKMSSIKISNKLKVSAKSSKIITKIASQHCLAKLANPSMTDSMLSMIPTEYFLETIPEYFVEIASE